MNKTNQNQMSRVLFVLASVAWFVAAAFSGQAVYIALGVVFLVLGLAARRRASTR